MNERMRSTTISMIKCYKQCKRRFFFQYVENLKLMAKPRPLSFGSAVHKGMEKILTGRPGEVWDTIFSCYDQETINEAGPDPYVAFECLRSWQECIDWSDWEVLEIEKEFMVSCGYAKRLIGKIDGLVKYNGKTLLLEHKTASSPNGRYLHKLLWDDQVSAYLYALNELGIKVDGVLYNILPKPTIKMALATPPEKRKFKKDGTLYANLRDQDETIGEYVERVRAWYEEHDRFIIHFVYRTPGQLEESRRQFNLIMKDMARTERYYTYFPNPQACSVLPCPYECICLEYTPEAVEGNFVRKEKRNEELDQVVSF